MADETQPWQGRAKHKLHPSFFLSRPSGTTDHMFSQPQYGNILMSGTKVSHVFEILKLLKLEDQMIKVIICLLPID